VSSGGRVVDRPAAQGGDVPEDRGERGPHLVGGDSDELLLAAVDLAQLSDHPPLAFQQVSQPAALVPRLEAHGAGVQQQPEQQQHRHPAERLRVGQLHRPPFRSDRQTLQRRESPEMGG